jgi:Flp pilus assembly protein TadG
MSDFAGRPRLRRPGSRTRGERARETGQSVVEFALIAPIMMFLIVAIMDLSRIYTAMVSVESAAREAADFGTSLGAERWSATNLTATVNEMERRACIAASELPDFEFADGDADGQVDAGEPCSNPTFAYCLSSTTPTPPAAPTCTDPTDSGYDCDVATRPSPCTVTVTMGHVFHLFAPMQLDFFGVRLGLPATLSFTRDSTFAMTDIDVAP